MGRWLTDTFQTTGGGQVLVYVDAEGNATGFDPSDPAGLFATIATTPPTYAALSALPCATQGWQKVFGAWKAAGKVA